MRSNHCTFNQLPAHSSCRNGWHPACSLTGQQLVQDWLPGVAGTQPRLRSGFGGQIKEGGLHQPPFSFLGGWPVIQESNSSFGCSGAALFALSRVGLRLSSEGDTAPPWTQICFSRALITKN